jgi:uncharacterized protein (DUF885 family)
MPWNAEGGYHNDFARLVDAMPFRTTRDYENYLSRLRAFPAFSRQHLENLRQGLRDGFTQPRAILEGSIGPPRRTSWTTSQERLLAALRVLPAAVPEADRARLLAAARTVIGGEVVPAYRQILEFVNREYLPAPAGPSAPRSCPRGARTTSGACATSRPSTGAPTTSTRSASPRSCGFAARWTR